MRTTEHAPTRSPRATTDDAPIPRAMLDAGPIADVVRLPPRSVVSIDGQGEPAGAAFQEAIGAAYGVAYTLKFARKADGRDFKIGALEARWWSDVEDRFISQIPPREWRWRVRLAVPRDVTKRDVADVIRIATTKRGGKLEGSEAARRVTLERVPAMRVGRVLHVGPYAEESRSFAKILAAIEEAGLAASHAHLEIYLSDPRRTAPAKLRTVLLLETA